MDECPSRAWISFGCAPAAISREAQVCRRSWLCRRRHNHDLRHTFGTAMAGTGVPMRTLQEWMGHRDIETTQRYADYSPSAHESAFVESAFGSGGGSRPLVSQST